MTTLPGHLRIYRFAVGAIWCALVIIWIDRPSAVPERDQLERIEGKDISRVVGTWDRRGDFTEFRTVDGREFSFRVAIANESRVRALVGKDPSALTLYVERYNSLLGFGSFDLRVFEIASGGNTLVGHAEVARVLKRNSRDLRVIGFIVLVVATSYVSWWRVRHAP